MDLDRSRKHLIKACRQAVGTSFTTMSQTFFDELDDSLFDMAERSDSNAKQSEFFDIMREMRKSRQQMHDHFSDALLETFDGFWTELPKAVRATSNQESDEEISLLPVDDLEIRLATTAMASRAENGFADGLTELGLRIARLMQREAIDEKLLPVAPAAICEAFNETMTLLQSPLELKLVIYKIFDKNFMSRLNEVYSQLNLILAQGGILPIEKPRSSRRAINNDTRNIRHTPQADKQAEAHPEGTIENATPPRNTRETDEADAMVADVYNTLRELLSHRSIYSNAAYPTHPDIPQADPMEMIHALNTIQESLRNSELSHDEPLRLHDVRRELLQSFSIGHSRTAHKAIGKSEDEVIDIISMLFDFILNDPNIPDRMKILLSRLQIPMVKVAMLDSDFFARKQHPARKLLNSLAQLAAKWDTGANPKRDAVYLKVESVVRHLLEGFDDDIDLFSKINKELDEFVLQEDARMKISEDRAIKVSEGKERLAKARMVSDREIETRLHDLNGKIPPVTKALAEGPWKDVLILTYLRDGPDSAHWHESLSILDKVIRSTQPVKDAGERHRILGEIPYLVKELQDRMQAISFDQHKMNQIFKELRTQQIACLRGVEFDPPAEPAPPPEPRTVASQASENEDEPTSAEAVKEESDTPPVASTAHHSDEAPINPAVQNHAETTRQVDPPIFHDQHQEVATNAKPGTWFEWWRDGEIQKIKLSWRGSFSSQCVFVNRQGIKAAEMSESQLADYLRNNILRRIDDTHGSLLVDRAMNAMVAILHREREAQQPKR